MANIKTENTDHTNVKLITLLKTLQERCNTEAATAELTVPLNDSEARISYYSGLSTGEINKLLLDKPRICFLDIRSRILILETVKFLHVHSKLPNFLSIFQNTSMHGKIKTVNDKTIDLDEFVIEMEILGYVWKDTTVKNIRIIMEDPEVRFERYMYLNKLKKFRNNSSYWKQIVYIDERLVNNNQHFEKPWLTDTKLSTGLECLFIHAASKHGFICGMFSDQDTEDDFCRWLSNILLGHLKSPSVIIMDNNPMHGGQRNVCPITRYHSKTDMIRWLTNNDIPCSSNMSKPTLYELIKKCNNIHNIEFKIDSIIRSQGHEVLRLPRHFYDLSITTPLWENIVSNGGVGMPHSFTELQSMLLKLLTDIDLQKWAQYEKIVEKMEKEIFNIDMTMEHLCDKYELKLSNNLW